LLREDGGPRISRRSASGRDRRGLCRAPRARRSRRDGRCLGDREGRREGPPHHDASPLDEGHVAGKSLDDALRRLHRAATAGQVSAEFADQLHVVAIERLPPRRTGTAANVTNDVDFSLLGPDAAEHRQLAMADLARTLDCANTPEASEHIVRAGAFTDPRRAYLDDVLEPDVAMPSRPARRHARRTSGCCDEEHLRLLRDEEHLRLLRDLRLAEEAGEFATAGALRAELDAGLPISRYRPLSAADRLRLGRNQAKLVARIGDAEALVNVSEGGGDGRAKRSRAT
jgi:hypothetical protein